MGCTASQTWVKVGLLRNEKGDENTSSDSSSATATATAHLQSYSDSAITERIPRRLDENGSRVHPGNKSKKIDVDTLIDCDSRRRFKKSW